MRVPIVGPPASAPVSTASASIERCITRVCSASSSCARGWVISVRKAFDAAAEPNNGFFNAFNGTEPVGETWY